MGRTYSYECEKCGYRPNLAGGITGGNDLVVQTIHCLDCNLLYDAITSVRMPVSAPTTEVPLPLEEIMRRLPLLGHGETRWDHFKLACPFAPEHEIQEWKEPGKCPRCDVFMERSVIPFRQWE